jgi:putative Mg2+ transporter-C (MgtC) family protein
MEAETIFKLFLALFLGALIGLEREIKRKEAGLQTYTLVVLGTCLFTIMGFQFFSLFFNKPGVHFDPLVIIQAVATGIGFIGAGVIFRGEEGVRGLTTAAGLWVAAAIGVSVGANFYFLAVLTTIFTILVFSGFGLIEEKFFKK